MFNLKKVKKLKFENEKLCEEIKEQNFEIMLLKESARILNNKVNSVGLRRDEKGIFRSLKK